MKILLLGLGIKPNFDLPPHYVENYVKDIPDCEIITFGYNKGVDIQIDLDDDFEKVLERLPPKWIPDYCLMYNLVQNLLPKGIEKAPFPTIYMALDWDYHVPLARTNAESVDLQLVGGENAKESVEALGANNVEVFYDCGIMKEFFPPNLKKIKDRKYDIFYTANVTEVGDQGYSRLKWVYKLCDLAEKYKYKILILHHFPSYAEYLKMLHDSKMALSFNKDGHMSFRVLEAGSQGTVILDTGAQIRKYFEPENEFIPITEDNFFHQVQQYLQNEHALQEMSERFHKKVCNDFESRKHFVKIIELANKVLSDKRLTRRYRVVPQKEKLIRRGELYYYVHFRGAGNGYFPEHGNKFIDLSYRNFKKAMAVESEPRTMMNLAVVTASAGIASHDNSQAVEKINEAISILKDLITSYPSYALAYYNLGHMYLRLNDCDNALVMFNTALAELNANNSDVDPWALHIREYDNEASAFQLGRLLDNYIWSLCRGEDAGSNENIRTLFKAATLYYISYIDEQRGNIYSALDALTESYYLYPNFSMVALLAAQKSALLGYREKSLVFYQNALRLSPFEISSRIEYIRHLLFCGLTGKAVTEIKEALKICKTVTVLQKYVPELKQIVAEINSSFSYSP